MKKTHIVAHKGEKFALEWYYAQNGHSEAREYFAELSDNDKEKLIYLFYHLGSFGKILNIEKFRSEGDSIYAIKSSQHRFFCFFFDGAKIIITNAYMKKSDKMPLREKQRALRAREDYMQRCKRGVYYEN